MNRILVIRGGAIGDFVLTLPAIKLLRDAFPRAWIEILGYRHIVALAENRFYADAVRSIESGTLARFFAKDAELPKDLVGYFGGFDLIVSYLFDPDKIFERNLRRCGVEDFLACSPKIEGEDHAATHLARPMAELGLILTHRAAALHPSEADRDFAHRAYPEAATIAIHPGSGSAEKNWPLENWITLHDRLQLERADASFLIIGGEADGQQLARLRSLESPRLRFAENLPLEHLAAVLERSVLFLGHDSGISHIAAAVGTRCVLLFGKTDPKLWAPANANGRVLQSRTGMMRDISVEDVLAASL